MRYILMYDFLSELGGLEKLMATHARFLLEQGHDVLLLFGTIKPEMLTNEMFQGLLREQYGKNTLLAIFGFNHLKQIIKPDDILISYSFPVNYAIRKFKNKKIQYMNHFPNFLYLPMSERLVWANTPMRKLTVLASIFGGFILRAMDKKLMKNNSLIFENSKFTKKRLDKIYGIKGIVSYPSVSPDFKPSNIWIKNKYCSGKFIFASGRVIPDKRVDWLIESFAQIFDKKIKLLVSGQIDDKYKKELMELAKKLGVSSRIKFLGIIPKEDLIVLLSTAKAYVFPTPREDFGLAPAEAISCGTPVVVWGDGSGPNEQIIDGLNGFHAKPYSIKHFAWQIDRCLEETWNKEEIAESAKKFSAEEVKKSFIGAL